MSLCQPAPSRTHERRNSTPPRGGSVSSQSINLDGDWDDTHGHRMCRTCLLSHELSCTDYCVSSMRVRDVRFWHITLRFRVVDVWCTVTCKER